MKSVLHKYYSETVVPALKKELGYKNIMQVPRVEKVVLNVGYGKHVKDKNYIEHVEKTLAMISGQKPVHNKTTKSISNFKIRSGMAIGASVTVRGEKMYEFLYKLINLAFPRVRDFRGISPKSFDRSGNYSVGLKEQLAFPEVTAEMGEVIHGIEITVVTNAKTKEEGLALLKKLGFPFKDK